MIIKVGNFECTEVWDRVFYKKLSRYPQITDWELRTIIEFIEYERKYGRECRIECNVYHYSAADFCITKQKIRRPKAVAMIASPRSKKLRLCASILAIHPLPHPHDLPAPYDHIRARVIAFRRDLRSHVYRREAELFAGSMSQVMSFPTITVL